MFVELLTGQAFKEFQMNSTYLLIFQVQYNDYCCK
jgi:hypothetical protein